MRKAKLPPIKEVKPKRVFVNTSENFSITYDAVVHIKQDGFQGGIPVTFNLDKKKFTGLSKEETQLELYKIIKKDLLEKVDFIDNVEDIDIGNIKYPARLTDEGIDNI